MVVEESQLSDVVQNLKSQGGTKTTPTVVGADVPQTFFQRSFGGGGNTTGGTPRWWFVLAAVIIAAFVGILWLRHRRNKKKAAAVPVELKSEPEVKPTILKTPAPQHVPAAVQQPPPPRPPPKVHRAPPSPVPRRGSQPPDYELQSNVRGEGPGLHNDVAEPLDDFTPLRALM
jgi:hypothetical protein